MGFYETLPGDGDTIRLFYLHPSSDAAAEIEFSLQQESLAASDCKYEALSYTWGELHSTRRIFLRRNGSTLPVNIQENLYNCLLRLRYVKTCRTLWIDAICINQDDLTEKGQQITLMPRIYSGAELVLAWLGEATNYFEIFSFDGWGGSQVGTEAFFRRPYWERTWIIQENLNAREVTFRCGRHEFSRETLSAILLRMEIHGVHGERTEHQSRALTLVRGKTSEENWEKYGNHDGGFSHLLANHSTSKCANKLDIVYALLGILHESAPALKISIDYAATTTQLFIRAIDQMDTTADIGETAAVGLQRALDLTWPSIIVAMHETENHLNISQCLIAAQPAYKADFLIIEEPCLKKGDPTLSNPPFYTRNLGSPHANFRNNVYAETLRQELSRFKAPEQSPMWATHGSVRHGDYLFKCRGRDSSADFALVFRLGPDDTWPCIGCAWKPTSSEADDTPAESRTIQEYIVSSGLFLHAYLQAAHLAAWQIYAPSRLFALTQAYTASDDSMVRKAALQEVRNKDTCNEAVAKNTSNEVVGKARYYAQAGRGIRWIP